jgi:hypothetical protein
MIYPQFAPQPDHPTLKELQTDWAIAPALFLGCPQGFCQFVLLLQLPPVRPVPLQALPHSGNHRSPAIKQTVIRAGYSQDQVNRLTIDR